MSAYVRHSIALILLSIAGCGGATRESKGMADLVGKWRVDSLHINGQESPKELKPSGWIIDGSTIVWHTDGRETERSQYVLDRETTPWSVDVTNSSGGLFRGICARKNGELIIVYSIVNDGKRPTNFQSEEQSGTAKVVLTRLSGK